MRLSVFIIALLTITNLQAQVDSVGRVRKPVLAYLIGEHYRANNLAAENSILRNQADELRYQITQYQKLVASHRADSLLCDSLIALHERTGITWKSSYEAEKINHKKTKKSLLTWKIYTMVAVAANIYLISKTL